MIEKYKNYNNITGWIVFLIATATYLLTIEPTTSFWDCGEFITSAYKLEVGHPPGAPLFMLLGRLFSAFVPMEYASTMLNVLSALSSSFTILFLFWSITALAKKAATYKSKFTGAKQIAVLFSGAIGALAYTFSDSFWFSAVEGEVYAMSSLFTAVVFWAILKWEASTEKGNETRWLILIAYLMGLSIGVHLLNLLSIPAIMFVYYFKKYEVTPWGVVKVFLASGLSLFIILYVINIGLIKLTAGIEKLFVNSMGLPFNSGVIFTVIGLIAFFVYIVYYSQKNKKVLLNIFSLCTLVIVIGYSSFSLILIRSQANPPLDENNPENVFSLIPYLNREQYGDRPLLSGQYFNTPLEIRDQYADGTPVITKSYSVYKGKRKKPEKTFITEFDANNFIAENKDKNLEIKHEYIVSDKKENAIPNYANQFTTLFPRMYSSDSKHVPVYKTYSGFQETKSRLKKYKRTDPQTGRLVPMRFYHPTFGDNLQFFFTYQLRWMYWRYFMWNFSGRQNDIQGHGDMLRGNWMSGVKLLDKQRLGNQDYLPSTITENRGHNKFYMLPLILGLIGLVWQLFRHTKDWIIVLLLFFLTGVAIIIYLNPTPMQPRERDYAYVGSFYAFAIWIGLGVYALFDFATYLNQKNLKNIGVGLGSIAGLVLLFSLISDSNSFSYSFIYIAIVGAAALGIMYLIKQFTKNDKINAFAAGIICLSVPMIMVAEGWDDHSRAKRYTARDFAKNYLDSCDENAILFTNGDNDTFPLWYVQEVENYRTDVRVVNLSLLNTDWYVNQMKRRAYKSDPVPFNVDEEKYRQGTRDLVVLFDEYGKAMNVKEAVEYAVDDKNLREFGSGKRP